MMIPQTGCRPDQDSLKYTENPGSLMVKGLSLLVILLLLAPYAAADGMIFVGDRDMWYLQPEQNQMAAIHYEDGMENLLISVSPGTDFKGERAVWIFPVPAAPETVKVDILKNYPRFTGSPFEDKYISVVSTTAAVSVLYATFPVSLFCGGAAVLSAFVFGMAGNISKADLQVYDRVEKMGVVTEVVAASDAGALNNFLLLRGMKPTREGQEMLVSYIGQNYTFVVTSIGNVTQFREETKQDRMYYDPYNGASQANMIGVSVRFPASRIYFPLKPTAVYGTREVPVLLYVTGYVSPDTPATIVDRTEVTYFSQGRYEPPAALVPFFNGKTTLNELKYTKIKITAPSDRFAEDLWIDPSPPADMVAKETYLDFAGVIAVIVYILFSALSSLVAGTLVFRRKAVDKKTLLLHGLWNCLTFAGLAVATRGKFPQEEFGRRTPYILAFYATFGLLFSLYSVLLAPSLAFPVLLGWGGALLSPILSLALLFFIPMMLGSVYSWNAGSLIFAFIVSVFLLVFAFLPVPALLWLRRWMDPEAGAPEPGVGQTLTAMKERIFPSYAGLADYEQRWGKVYGAGLILLFIGAVLQAQPYGPVLATLGLWGILVAVIAYATNILDCPGRREKALAFALIAVPLAVYEFLVVIPPNPTAMVSNLVASGIAAAVILFAAVLLRRLVLYRSARTWPQASPDLRMVFWVLVVTCLLLVPPVIGALGMENPRAQYLTGLGDVKGDAGKYEEAREAYHQAILADSGYATAFEHRGDLSLKRGECSWARSDYQIALRNRPGDAGVQAKLQEAEMKCRSG